MQVLLQGTDSPGMEGIFLDQISTPIGTMIAGVTVEGICMLEFMDRKGLQFQMRKLHKLLNATFTMAATELTSELKSQLDDYFNHRRTSFNLPLIMTGTEFQQSAWQSLLEIPPGSTRTYQEQSIAIGRKEAIRAVAKANGENRLCILIPCHRIIGSNGKLTGYSGGIWRKRWLLDHERNASDNQP